MLKIAYMAKREEEDWRMSVIYYMCVCHTVCVGVFVCLFIWIFMRGCFIVRLQGRGKS